jgi:large-conductance mechanosensitive channel
MYKEFKEFVMRGNVVDLAIAVVIGDFYDISLVHPLVIGGLTNRAAHTIGCAE